MLPVPTPALAERLASVGTGFALSVPAVSPTDYACVRELQRSAPLRRQLGVREEWVVPYTPLPVVDVPGLGPACGRTACEIAGVTGPHDEVHLAQACVLAEEKAANEGLMMAREFAGELAPAVRMKVRQDEVEEARREDAGCGGEETAGT